MKGSEWEESAWTVLPVFAWKEEYLNLQGGKGFTNEGGERGFKLYSSEFLEEEERRGLASLRVEWLSIGLPSFLDPRLLILEVKDGNRPAGEERAKEEEVSR